jgi:hypothetical protein
MTTLERRKPKTIHYPDSDGKPMAVTHLHVLAFMLANHALQDILHRRHGRLWVASNICWYFLERDRKKRISPDTMADRLRLIDRSNGAIIPSRLENVEAQEQ